jgi:hypothetical protein
LDTLIIDRTWETEKMNIPNNIDILTNISCLIIQSGNVNLDGYRILKTLPKITVIYRSFGRDTIWNGNNEIKTK